MGSRAKVRVSWFSGSRSCVLRGPFSCCQHICFVVNHKEPRRSAKCCLLSGVPPSTTTHATLHPAQTRFSFVWDMAGGGGFFRGWVSVIYADPIPLYLPMPRPFAIEGNADCLFLVLPYFFFCRRCCCCCLTKRINSLATVSSGPQGVVGGPC